MKKFFVRLFVDLQITIAKRRIANLQRKTEGPIPESVIDLGVC